MRTMMKAIGTMAALAISAGTARATTYWCDASKSLAAIATPATSAVNVTADRPNQECRFSVNGEPVGSPPRDLVVTAHNTLRKGAMGEALRSGNVDPLAYALLASSRDREIPEALRALLKKHAVDIAKCFDQLQTGQVGMYASSPGLECRVASGKEDARVRFSEVRGQPTIETAPALLVLGAVNDKVEHYLFVPAPYVSGKFAPLK